MIVSEYKELEPDLMDVVRLFPGADALAITHSFQEENGEFVNSFSVDGEDFSVRLRPEEDAEKKSLVKRYAKLALYRILSERYQKTLPWGSLTGIRPTKLAYARLEAGAPFQSFFRTLGVSEENIFITEQVIKGQEGIYKKDAGVDLYVSLPFCPSRCEYCSFITAPIQKTRQYIPAYLEALAREIEAAKPWIKGLRSVYVGGGTPFALEAAELKEVYRLLAPLVKEGIEYTVEAGRADVFTEEKLALSKEFGVTRLCINAQSFSDKTLQTIGRNHTARQAVEAFEMTRPFGFTLNCDLIAGLTGESLLEFCQSVDTAIGLRPENITVHTLCLKKGARLKEEVASLGDGELSEMISYSRKALFQAGYAPYYLYRQKYMAGAHENVGWTKKGFASVYNIDVMEECANNLAVGANAISKRVFCSENRIERLAAPKDIPTYLEKVGRIIEEKNRLFS